MFLYLCLSFLNFSLEYGRRENELPKVPERNHRLCVVPENTINAIQNSNRYLISKTDVDEKTLALPKQRLYKTAREEFFKDFMNNESCSISNTTYDEFKRSIENNDLDPIKYLPKVRVSGKTTVPKLSADTGLKKTFLGSFGTSNEPKKESANGYNVNTLADISEDTFPIDLSSYQSTNKYGCRNTHESSSNSNTSYGSLKKRKQLQTANLSNLLR